MRGYDVVMRNPMSQHYDNKRFILLWEDRNESVARMAKEFGKSTDSVRQHAYNLRAMGVKLRKRYRDRAPMVTAVKVNPMLRLGRWLLGSAPPSPKPEVERLPATSQPGS